MAYHMGPLTADSSHADCCRGLELDLLEGERLLRGQRRHRGRIARRRLRQHLGTEELRQRGRRGRGRSASHAAAAKIYPWLLARHHPVAVVARAYHEVWQDAAVPGDAAVHAHRGGGGGRVGCGGGGRLRLHGGEGGEGVGAVLLLPGEVLQGGGLLLLLQLHHDEGVGRRKWHVLRRDWTCPGCSNRRVQLQ